MTAKIVAFLLTLFINIAVGVVVFFFMLLAMNGFSESDVSYGLGTYIVLAVLVSLAMASAALILVSFLLKKLYRSWIAVMISVSIFSITGAGLKIVCSMIGVLVTDFVSTH